MTALSITNMKQSQRYHNELDGGDKLNQIERLGVRLQVARSLQKQTNWEQIVRNGEAMEENILNELYEIQDTDPAHIARAEPEQTTDWGETSESYKRFAEMAKGSGNSLRNWAQGR